MKKYFDYNLLKHNTFGVSAKCNCFIEIESVEDTTILPSFSDAPYMIIGSGSNLLLTKDYDGTILHSAIRGINAEISGDNVLLKCGSGGKWDDIVAYCVDHGYYGAENLSLIPGDVGASAVQNIGAYGSEIKDILKSVEAVEISTGKNFVFSSSECNYSYRSSVFKKEFRNRFFITYVTYQLSLIYSPKVNYGNICNTLESKGIFNPTAKQLRDTIIDIRTSKLPDPNVLGNAGSFFMNPIVEKSKVEQLLLMYPNMPHYNIDDDREKIPAGWMIEQCGWKGRRLGSVGVHDKQALVLINCGGATGKEIVDLCTTIQNDVQKKFGIKIIPEVNII